MKLGNKTKKLVTVIAISLCLSSTGLTGDRYVLHYDKPAMSDSGSETTTQARGRGGREGGGYMRNALLLGNGRLGAMFGGGIDQEHLALNEISAWANTSRGRDEASQSGVRIASYKHLETVRTATRNEQYGSGPNSVEAIATKYLSSQLKLGNYTSFTEVFISTGHEAAKVENYQRALNMRTGVGTVSYTIGDSKFMREYFCSYPNDLLVVRYTSDGEPLNLKIQSSTKHETKLLQGDKNRTVLVGETPMVKDNVEFMQLVHVLSKDTQDDVIATPEGIITVRN